MLKITFKQSDGECFINVCKQITQIISIFKMLIYNTMAANLFGRYVWLIDTIRRHKRITYAEINKLWGKSGLSYGDEDAIPLRTFHNHRLAIQDIFGVTIECDIKDGYKYYIVNPEQLENDGLRTWLIDSYATLNQLHADEKLANRIQFENIPSGNKFLTTIVEAMRLNTVIEITHKGFGKSRSNTFYIEPYFVKIVNRRWYVIARSPYDDLIRTYGLDRISSISVTDETFTIPEDFDADSYFEGCCGVITDEITDIEKVVIRASCNAQEYIETLPLHSSQRMIAQDADSATYEYTIRPTYDFFQTILSQADKIEVLEPEWVRDVIKLKAKNIMSCYNKK